MEELLKQYKLASTGDLPAIKYLIANMGEGKILKTNKYALLQWYIKLGCENDNDAYEKLFSPSNIEALVEVAPGLIIKLLFFFNSIYLLC